MSLLRLNAIYDDEARVWTVSDDQLGLVAEAETVDVLEYKLKELIPELAELNGIELPRPIQFTLVSEKTTSAFAGFD
jgi:hypothetical protein